MMNLLVPSLASLLLLGTAASPFGDIFVDQAAVNCATGTGTAVDPVCTIPAAIALAVPGDTIHVAPGTYLGGVTLPFDLELSGTAGQAATILNGQNTGPVITIPATVSGTVDGFTIRNGHANPIGGGVRVVGNLVIRNSTITANRTSGYQGLVGGGGIGALTGGSSVEIDGCTISENNSDREGGGVAIHQGSLLVRNSTISGNETFSAQYRGGGIFSTASLIQVTNSTISGNLSGDGGGLYAGNSLAGSGLWSSTVSGNYAGGGGLKLSQLGSFELGNSIVAGNYYMYYPPFDLDILGPVTSAGHNLVGIQSPGLVDGVNGDQVGTHNDRLNAGIGPLADNGGPTLTHALLAGSRAIDSGDPASPELFDQRGVARPLGATHDVGAVEYDGPVTSFCNGDGGDQLGCTDCPCSNNSTAGTFGGCLNELGLSARLKPSGSESVSLSSTSTEDLRFGLIGLPPATLAVLNSGDALAPFGPANPCFGQGSGVPSASLDGLRCAVQNTRRHGSRTADANGVIGATNDPWGGEGAPATGLANAFGGFIAGQRRYFQAIYRANPLASCMRGLNTTQAVEITFQP